MNDALALALDALTVRSANNGDYVNRTPILPGDHVMKRGGRANGKVYLVVGIHYMGGDYRLDLCAVSGGVRNSTAMAVEQADWIAVTVDPYQPMFKGASMKQHATRAFYFVSARLSAAECRASCRDNGVTTFGSMLRALRDRYAA